MNDSKNNMKPLVYLFSNDKNIGNQITQNMLKNSAYSLCLVNQKPSTPYSILDPVLKTISEKRLKDNRRILLLFDYNGFEERFKSHPYYTRLSALDNITIGFFGRKSLESSIQECLVLGTQDQELSDKRTDLSTQSGSVDSEQSFLDLNNVVQELKTIADSFNAFLKDKTVERGIQSQLRNDIAEISQKLSELKRIEKQWISSISDFLDSLMGEAFSLDLGKDVQSAAMRHSESLLEYLEAVQFERITPRVGDEWKKDSGIAAKYPEDKVVNREEKLIIQEILDYGYKYRDSIVKKAIVIVDNPSEGCVAKSQNDIQNDEGKTTNLEMKISEPDYSQPENMSQSENQNGIQNDEGKTTNLEMKISEPDYSQPENMSQSENQNENLTDI